MTDDDLLTMLRERWRGTREKVSASAGRKPMNGDWADIVQLNVRVPAQAKRMIERLAAARGETLAQFIVAACTKQESKGAP